MPKYFIPHCIIIFCLLAANSKAVLAQGSNVYLNKIETIIRSNKNAGYIFKNLDSLKGTCIPSISSIKLHLNRTLDVGFKQQFIQLQLNGLWYNIFLLTRNDSAYNSIMAITGASSIDNKSPNFNRTVCDTAKTLEFLTKRNRIYNIRKSIEDMKTEFVLEKRYALYCGIGVSKTQESINLDKLVAKKDVGKLREMLQSINCETQAYGAAGFDMLKKKGYKLIDADEQMLKHIKIRNTDLITCVGCFSGVVAKQYR